MLGKNAVILSRSEALALMAVLRAAGCVERDFYRKIVVGPEHLEYMQALNTLQEAEREPV